MTGACMRTMQMISSRNLSELIAARRFSHNLFQSEPLAWDRADLYSWLFYTRAFFHEGGEYWTFWNKQMLPQLLGNQKPDGSWQRSSVFMGGSESDSTALGVLMLETYYRDKMTGENGKTTQRPVGDPMQVNPAAPAPPAAVIQAPSSSSQPIEVKLDLLASGGIQKKGNYRLMSAATTATKPISILKMPEGIEEAEFWKIKMGPASSQRTYDFIIDRPDSASPRLFVDRNANGDLTDDPPATWKLVSSNGKNEKNIFHAYGEFKLDLRSNEETMVVQVRAQQRTTRKESESGAGEILYYTDYVRIGSTKLGGKTLVVLLSDDYCKGDFSDPSCKFHIDINEDGRYDSVVETFPIKSPFNVGGTTYEISGMTPSGSSFQIIPSIHTVAESKPSAVIQIGKTAPSFDATTLMGDKVSFPAGYKGKLLLLAFWDTLERRSQKEIPDMISAYKKYRPAGMEFLGICMDKGDNATNLQTRLKDLNMNWPQICDGLGYKGAIVQQYCRWNVPTFILLDGDSGTILGLWSQVSGREPAIVKALAEKKR
jgi:peroxiredoxin